MRQFISTLMLSALLVVVGCGDSGRPPLGEVSGTVSYQGQPLKTGSIVLEVPGARPANGKIVDGKITDVTTYEPGDGVPVGNAQIAIFATSLESEPATPATPATPDQNTQMSADYMGGGSSLIPAKYNDPNSSGLTQEIASGSNTLTLELTD